MSLMVTEIRDCGCEVGGYRLDQIRLYERCPKCGKDPKEYENEEVVRRITFKVEERKPKAQIALNTSTGPYDFSVEYVEDPSSD